MQGGEAVLGQHGVSRGGPHHQEGLDVSRPIFLFLSCSAWYKRLQCSAKKKKFQSEKLKFTEPRTVMEYCTACWVRHILWWWYRADLV